MSHHEQPLFGITITDVLATISADYDEYRYYGGRFDFETWWQRYADDYPEVTA